MVSLVQPSTFPAGDEGHAPSTWHQKDHSGVTPWKAMGPTALEDLGDSLSCGVVAVSVGAFGETWDSWMRRTLKVESRMTPHSSSCTGKIGCHSWARKRRAPRGPKWHWAPCPPSRSPVSWVQSEPPWAVCQTYCLSLSPQNASSSISRAEHQLSSLKTRETELEASFLSHIKCTSLCLMSAWSCR